MILFRLLERDPLAGVRNLSRIAAVITPGRVLDAIELRRVRERWHDQGNNHA